MSNRKNKRNSRNSYKMMGMGSVLESADRRLKDKLGIEAFGGVKVARMRGLDRTTGGAYEKYNFNGYHLSVPEALFLHHLTDSSNPETFMNKKESVKRAGYKLKKDNALRARASDLMKRPEVKRALSERFNDEEIDNMIDSGVRQRLSDPESKHWQETANFVAKCRGDFAKGHEDGVGMSRVEREERMAKIEKLVGADPILLDDDDEDIIDLADIEEVD